MRVFRNLCIAVVSLALAASIGSVAWAKGDRAKPTADAVRAMADGIVWASQSSIFIPSSITGGPSVWLDPVGGKVPKDKPADLVLVSHSHGDHLSAGDITKVSKETTLVFGPKDCRVKGNFTEIKPGMSATPFEGVRVEAVPAYNTNKAYHPKSAEWCGYILDIKGVRVYFAGDTDLIPEMAQMDVDIALLPIGGTFTMTWKEAVQAALDMQAPIAIPMHYGSIVGKKADAQEFKKALEGKVEVIVK